MFHAMFPDFLIGFREALEAALIIGIIIGYLKKTDRVAHTRAVWRAVGLALCASVAAAWLFSSFWGSFSGAREAWFEGVLMLAGAVLITSAVLNLLYHLRSRQEIETKVEVTLTRGGVAGLSALVFFSVLREGVETIIFLSAADAAVPHEGRLGACFGIAAACLIGLLLFKGLIRLKLKHFFTVTSLLLMLFAAGLTAHGIHELQEAGAIPFLTQTAWNINPPARVDGSYPLMHDHGALGSILKGVLGYNGDPTRAEVLAYCGYLIILSLARRYFFPFRPRPSEAR